MFPGNHFFLLTHKPLVMKALAEALNGFAVRTHSSAGS
jgi:hypothetical protein